MIKNKLPTSNKLSFAILPHAAGDLDLKVTRQTIFPASKVMVESLRKNFASESVVVLPVHHVEDFHAYNFSECLPDQGSRSAHY